jgi:hypothetical protein
MLYTILESSKHGRMTSNWRTHIQLARMKGFHDYGMLVCAVWLRDFGDQRVSYCGELGICVLIEPRCTIVAVLEPGTGLGLLQVPFLDPPRNLVHARPNATPHKPLLGVCCARCRWSFCEASTSQRGPPSLMTRTTSFVKHHYGYSVMHLGIARLF